MSNKKLKPVTADELNPNKLTDLPAYSAAPLHISMGEIDAQLANDHAMRMTDEEISDRLHVHVKPGPMYRTRLIDAQMKKCRELLQEITRPAPVSGAKSYANFKTSLSEIASDDYSVTNPAGNRIGAFSAPEELGPEDE